MPIVKRTKYGKIVAGYESQEEAIAAKSCRTCINYNAHKVPCNFYKTCRSEKQSFISPRHYFMAPPIVIRRNLTFTEV